MLVVTITSNKVNRLVAGTVDMEAVMVPTRDKEEDGVDGMVEVEIDINHINQSVYTGDNS